MDVPKGTTTQLHYALSPHVPLTYMMVELLQCIVGQGVHGQGCHGNRVEVALFDGALYPLEHSCLAEINLKGFWLEYGWSKFG